MVVMTQLYRKWQFYLNPARFVASMFAMLPYLFVTMVFTLVIGLYHALWISPADYQMGDTVRIMYIHVPAVYGAMLCYGVLFVHGVFIITRRSVLSRMMFRSIIPVGFVLATIGLLSGSIWGYPTWGTFWVWDARLTSFFVLWILYALSMTAELNYSDRNSNVSSWIVIIGAVNLPVIKFSVDWFTTLHQPATLLRDGGASINTDMLTALLWMFVFVTLLIASCTILMLKGWHYHLRIKGDNYDR